MPRRPLSVFAVEDTTAQVCWSSLRGRHTVSAGASHAEIHGDGGPGATVLEALTPGARHLLRFDGRAVGWFRTLDPPPGPLLCRIAALTDLHVGDRRFGAWIPMGEKRRPGQEPFALRCARAGLMEALAWGADVIVLKGDLTRWGTRDEFDTVGRLLAELPVPVVAIPGNHDLKASSMDPVTAMRGYGVAISAEPAAIDLPGLRLVLANTAGRDLEQGSIDGEQRAAVVRLAGEAPKAACVVCHHHLQRVDPLTSWPPGVPAAESRALLDALAAANPATIVTTGHTHRYRRRRHGPVLVTTTGSPKDYPGAWTGYAVHEGGIRQVVRRIAAPDCIRWTQRTAHALLGGWALWSPGLRSHRCFTHRWPDRET